MLCGLSEKALISGTITQNGGHANEKKKDQPAVRHRDAAERGRSDRRAIYRLGARLARRDHAALSRPDDMGDHPVRPFAGDEEFKDQKMEAAPDRQR